MPKKIAFLTGKRGGYDAMRPLMQRVSEADDLQLIILACDQHLVWYFGQTNRRVAEELSGEVLPVEGPSLSKEGLFLEVLLRELRSTRPDALVLIGDRLETLLAACAATQLRIPILHLQAGDHTGCLDNVMRASISKMAHILVTSHEEATERLIRQGEQPWRIHQLGDPHLDPYFAGDVASLQEVKEGLWPHLDLELDRTSPEFGRIIICIQHPDTYHPEHSAMQMRATLSALREFSAIQTIVIYPCSDEGHDAVGDVVRSWSHGSAAWVPNLEGRIFRGLMCTADCIVGNSSAGIIEAPTARLPAVNIGSRQRGRPSSPGSTLHVQHNTNEIIEAIETALHAACSFEHPYGDGRVAEGAISILEQLEPTDAIMQKGYR